MKAYLDGVLVTRTWDGRIEGADECTQLWRKYDNFTFN